MRVVVRVVVVVLLFLLLASPVFAGWAADITINATDRTGRPLPSAAVTITYQKNACKKFNDKETGVTDDFGIARIHVIDQAPDDCVNYSYSVGVLYMGKSISTKQVFSINDSTPVINARFNLSVVSLMVKVVNFLDRPIPNVTVVMTSPIKENRTTGEGGEAEFHIMQDTVYAISASVFGKNASAGARITGDKVETLRILNYNYTLVVRATDNARRPIEGVKVSAVATRGVAAYAGVTDDEGVVEFGGMTSNEFKLSAEYEKLVQKRTVKFLNDYNEEIFVFNILVPPTNDTTPYNDSHPPNGNIADGGWWGISGLLGLAVLALGALGYLALVVGVSALIVLVLILVRKGALLYTLARLLEYVKMKLQRK